MDYFAYMRNWCSKCIHGYNQKYENNGTWYRVIGCAKYKQTFKNCIDDNIFESKEV